MSHGLWILRKLFSKDTADQTGTQFHAMLGTSKPEFWSGVYGAAIARAIALLDLLESSLKGGLVMSEPWCWCREMGSGEPTHGPGTVPRHGATASTFLAEHKEVPHRHNDTRFKHVMVYWC